MISNTINLCKNLNKYALFMHNSYTKEKCFTKYVKIKIGENV